MTEFGEYLARRSVSKARLARRTGLTVSRINDLTLKDNARPMAFEIYLVALALEVEPWDMLKSLYGHLKLKELTEEKDKED